MGTNYWIFLTGRLTIIVDNYETFYHFLPENISHIVFKIEGLIILVLLIYVVVGYFEIKISKNESSNQGEAKEKSHEIKKDNQQSQ